MGSPAIFKGDYVALLKQKGILFPDNGIWPGPTPVALGSGTAIDWSLSTQFTKTLTANTTFTWTNQKPGQEIYVWLTQDSTPRTVTWPTIKTTGGALVMSTASGALDLYHFIYNGTVTAGFQAPGLA